MESLYRQILKKAWSITRKFGYLWPLGIFVAFLGNGGEYQVLINQVSAVRNQAQTAAAWSANLNAFLPPLDTSFEKIVMLSLYFLVILAVLCFFVWLVVSALGGLIKGVTLANTEEKSTFTGLLKVGAKKFWTLLGLNLIAKAIVYGTLLLIITPLMIATFARGYTLLNLLITILSFLIFVPLTIIVSLATKYGSAFAVLNGENFKSAFINGWRLFRTNWLVSLEMALILFGINLLVGLAFILAALLIFSPFFFFGIAYTLENPDLLGTLMYISLTLLLLMSLAVGALLSVFQIGSWTLLYSRLTTGGKAYSKLVRWVALLPEKFKKKTV